MCLRVIKGWPTKETEIELKSATSGEFCKNANNLMNEVLEESKSLVRKELSLTKILIKVNCSL